MLDVVRPSPDYTLCWPRELFASEAQQLMDSAPTTKANESWTSQVTWLLIQAFTSTVPMNDFQDSPQRSTWKDTSPGMFSALTPMARSHLMYLRALVGATPRLPEETSPRPYYGARNGRAPAGTTGPADLATLRPAWLATIKAFIQDGYFARLAQECTDHSPYVPGDVRLDGAIADRLHQPGLWLGSNPQDWDERTFYELVEVMHDLVARPRSRWYHQWNDCGWHYEDHAPYPGRILYRWTVNRLFVRHGVDLALAKSGEDEGRLVRQPADPRGALVETVVANTTDPDMSDTVDHAVARFRARGATREDKRLACVGIAGVLERRRALIKSELLSNDEGALFLIANKFDLRHRDERQFSDYDGVFLDWLFWWYLSTVELTNRVLDRKSETVEA